VAKKPDMSNLFAKTEPEQAGSPDNSDLDSGLIRSIGIGLRQGEVSAIDGLAESLEVTRNQLLRYAVRWFLLEYRAGRVSLAGNIEEPPPPKKKLRLP
jgi:hypothetical protein